MRASSTAYSAVTGSTYTLGTLEQGLRSGNHLELIAKSAPDIQVQNGLPEGANLNVGEGAELDMGLGGSITFKAGRSIGVDGSLLAGGGQVSLGLLGARGVLNANNAQEAFGYLAGQTIRLGKQSVINVSGAVKAVEKPSAIARLQGLASPLVGEVLAGGTVTLGGVDGESVRGTLLTEAGSQILLNGASGLLSRDVSGAPTRISAAAGTLNIMSTDGFSLLGTVQASAPDASVAGARSTSPSAAKARSTAFQLVAKRTQAKRWPVSAPSASPTARPQQSM